MDETELYTDDDKILNTSYTVSTQAVDAVGDQLYVSLVVCQLNEQLRTLQSPVSVLHQHLWKEIGEDDTIFYGEQRVRVWQ